MLAVDCHTAMRWLQQLERENELFVYELKKEPAVDVRIFAGRVALHFLTALRDLSNDESERALLVEYAGHGMTSAILQALLHHPAPPILPPQKELHS